MIESAQANDCSLRGHAAPRVYDFMNCSNTNNVWKPRRPLCMTALALAFCAVMALGACSTGEIPTIEGLTAQQWYRKGNELWVNGRFVRLRDAVAYFSRAIELDPDFKEAYNSRGIAYDYLERRRLAIQDFDEAIDLDENYKHAYNNRGIVYKKLGELDDALEDFSRAIEIDQGYLTAYNNRGNVYRAVGQYGQAVKDYDRALEIKPDFARALANRAKLHFAMKNKPLACQDNRRACELGYRRSCRLVERKC